MAGVANVCDRCGEVWMLGGGHVCPDRAGQRIIPPQGGAGITGAGGPRPSVAPPPPTGHSGTTRPLPAADPACSRCRFFAPARKAGECRYHPPTSRSVEPWPFVEPTDFCGKFEPKPGAGLFAEAVA